ncbi:MAG: peptidoglycan-binding protein [Mariniblastus sp.]
MATLKLGSRGPEVAKLQSSLNSALRPSPNLTPDGIFGPQTQNAVRNFQRQARISADGIVGPQTQAQLAAASRSSVPRPTGTILRNGSRGDAVKKLQQDLNAKLRPSPNLNPDGNFGGRTQNAVLNFQRQAGLTADGIAGPQTLAALANATTAPGTPATPVAPPTPAAGSSSGSVSARGTDLLKSIEQLRLTPYNDQNGQDISAWVEGATIGYGHLISRGEWATYAGGITAAQAEALFVSDLQPYASAVQSGVTATITQNQFDALVILTFNIGIGGFQRSSVLKLVNNPAAQTPYSSLEQAWKAWNKSQGNVMQGLINRRNAEWNIYSQNIYQTW